MNINLNVLDRAVERTIRPFLIDQGELFGNGKEAYHHTHVLARVRLQLAVDAIEADPTAALEGAIKENVNLLSMYESSQAKDFIVEADADELRDQVLALLYGDGPLRDRIATFADWSQVRDGQNGKKLGINPTVIGYLLACASPEQYAFCKPTVYAAARDALLEPSTTKLSPIDRLVHTSEFYSEALKLFRQRYHLPFEDLFHVHAAFYVMSTPYHGLPGWKELEQLIEGANDMTNTPDLNVILYGPPGTGKTYDTIRRAVELCDGVVPDDRDEITARFRQLRAEHRIEFVTFHQSYGYEDFIEGLRPLLWDGDATDDDGSAQVRYECRDGIFKKLCKIASRHSKPKILLPELNLEETTVWKMSLGTATAADLPIYEECIQNNYILMGYGSKCDLVGCDDLAAIEDRLENDNPFAAKQAHLFKNELKQGDLIVISDGLSKFCAIGRVTGDYQYLNRESYAGMRPVDWLVVYEESQPRELISTAQFTQKTLYRFDPANINVESLMSLLTSSDRPANQNVVLIVDEINRGNISKILGELITLLEPDKRIGAKNELQVTLPASGELFGVPSNVYLIGTMNTADRSIAFLDVALRRRFKFVEMLPEYQLIRDLTGSVDGVDVARLLEVINERIELLYDQDHQIGHSFFLGISSLQGLRDAMCGKVIPLLQEYFYGDWSKICIVLGCPFDPESGEYYKKTASPVIEVRILKSESVIGSASEFIDNKARCRIARDFEQTKSAKTLTQYFAAIVGGE